MKVLEVMERLGIKETKKALVLIKEGLDEIQNLIPEKTTGELYNVVANQLLYSLPSNMIKLLGVYRKYETDTSTARVKYIRIGHVQHLDIVTQISSSATDAVDDIVVI